MLVRANNILRQMKAVWIWLAIAPIRFYKLFISPILPPACRYSPTCSMYAMEAIRRHGVFRGFFLAVYRLLRCNPFSRGGYDPVP